MYMSIMKVYVIWAHPEVEMGILLCVEMYSVTLYTRLWC